MKFACYLSPQYCVFLFSCAVVFVGPVQTHAQPPSRDQPGDRASVAVGMVAQIRQARSESFVGTLEPLRKSTVGSAVEGRVVSIDLFPGDLVTAGQPMMQLRTGTLEIQIKVATTALAVSQQALLELQASLPKDLELAKTRVAEAEARLKYSRTDYERSSRLRGNSGAISQGELELARSRYRADEQAVQAVRIEYQKLQATRQLRLEQARLNVQASEQEIERLNHLKKKYTIKAPFEGVVTQKLTDVGEWVTRGQAIIEVLQLDPIELIINVPQEKLPSIQAALDWANNAVANGSARSGAAANGVLPATVTINGVAGTLRGEVIRVVSQADLRSRTFPVRIRVSNPQVGAGYAIQPGMLGRATLMVGKETDMMMVKKDALVLEAGQKSIFKIAKRAGKDVAVELPVRTGAAVGNWIEVGGAGGSLAAGDRVVLLGNERLRSGQEVFVSQVIDQRPQEQLPLDQPPQETVRSPSRR